MTLRRGFELEAGEPVVVVEDVITTGGSTREVLDCVRARGAQVLAVGSLVDRSGGEVDLGLPRASLLPLEVEAWEAGEPARCAPKGKPGRRSRAPGRAGRRAARRPAESDLSGCRTTASPSPTTAPTSRAGSRRRRVEAARSRERSRKPCPPRGQGRSPGRGSRWWPRAAPTRALTPWARWPAFAWHASGRPLDLVRALNGLLPVGRAGPAGGGGGRRLSRPPQRALEGLSLHPGYGPRAASHPPPLRRLIRPSSWTGRRSKAVAELYLGRHDFASLASAGGSVKTTERTVLRSEVRWDDDDPRLRGGSGRVPAQDGAQHGGGASGRGPGHPRSGGPDARSWRRATGGPGRRPRRPEASRWCASSTRRRAGPAAGDR